MAAVRLSFRCALLPLLVSTGCGTRPGPTQQPHSGTDTSRPTPTAPPTTPSETWWVRGQEGEIAYVRRVPDALTPASYVITGIFATSLQGLAAAGPCVIDGVLCYGELPTEPDGWVDLEVPPFDAAASSYGWVGYQFSLGSIDVDFIHDAEVGLAYYRRELADPIDQGPTDVVLGGEWGEWSGAGALVVPSEVLTTEPGDRIFIDLSEPEVTFTWDASPLGELYLEVEGPADLHRLYLLNNDGSFSFPTSELGTLTLGDSARFELVRSVRSTSEVHGNTLATLGITRQRWVAGLPHPASCKAIQDANPGAVSGVHTVQPRPELPPVEVWCDFDTDGGGWTLVAASRGSPLIDEASEPYADLTTLAPLGAHRGVWDGMRGVVEDLSDIRFTCKATQGSEATVDLSFYATPWYREITTGSDADSCFNEANGLGADPAPGRRNNVTGMTLPEGDPWNAEGYLEGEDSCSDSRDFTVDFDDRGMDSNQSDGTDWGSDDDNPKCGVEHAANAAWFIFVREP